VAVSACSAWSDVALVWASAPALASAILLACWPALRDLRFRLLGGGGDVRCALIETSLFGWVAGAAERVGGGKFCSFAGSVWGA
jgi:hypothetical protein